MSKGPTPKDLTGQKFNLLTPIKYIGEGQSKWLYRCDCGSEIVTRSENLKNGHTKSCGCLKKKKDINDLTDKTFGYLQPISYKHVTTSDGHKRIKWLCKCKCGNTIECFSTALIQGACCSCGCLKKNRIMKI